MIRILLIFILGVSQVIYSQITLCELITVTGSQSELIMEVNSDIPVDLWTVNWSSSYAEYYNSIEPGIVMPMQGQPDPFNNPNIYSVYQWGSMAVDMPLSDTLISCLWYGNEDFNSIFTCCITWAWNGTSWVNDLMQTELIEQIESFGDNKIYDLMGRELKDIPINTIYIRNKKIYKLI